MASIQARSWAPDNVAEWLRGAALSALRTTSRGLLLDKTIAFWRREIDASWSLAQPFATVVDIVHETHDVKTFVLGVGKRWPGHRAGQFVPVTVEIDGVHRTRCYSLSSAPGEVALTVKRIDGGRVSSFLHDRVRTGDLVRLGAPTGDFVVSSPPTEPLLLLSAGSGVTPLMSILRDLAARDALLDVVFVHAARSMRDVIFRDELESLAKCHPGFRLRIHLDDDSPVQGHFDADALRANVPDIAQRRALMCGPSGWMDRMASVWVDAGIEDRLSVELFSLGKPQARPMLASVRDREDASNAPQNIELLRSKRGLVVTEGGSVLEQLERAGERPSHGCRMGICNTCACRKRSGVVENTVTGARSSEPDEEIRICVSRALSDLELDL